MNSVVTEITDTNGGWVLYDADCAFCTRWARRGERVLRRRGFSFQPLNGPAAEMKVVMPTGETLGGTTALVYLARQVWWAWPLWALSRLPGVMTVLECAYHRSARYCNHRVNGFRRPVSSLTRRWTR